MKKIIYPIIILLISITTFAIIIDPREFFNNIISILQLWLYKVYPSIFTFYILASLLINTKLINKIVYLFRFMFKHLKFKNEKSLHLFILSVFTSNPSSSSLICDAIETERITKEEADELLKYASFLGPLFILSFVLGFSIKYALIVILVHVLANFLICAFYNFKNTPTKIENCELEFSLEKLLNSINKGVSLLLMISGVMVFSGIFRYSIIKTFEYFEIYHIAFDLILANIEISLGLHTVLNLNLPDNITLLIMCFLCGFGGFSVHLQVVTVINKYSLSYANFFIHRLFQALIATILFIFFLML